MSSEVSAARQQSVFSQAAKSVAQQILQKSLTTPHSYAKDVIAHLEAVQERVAEVSKPKPNITRKDYPEIVKLKLAGHSDDTIAKKLGVAPEQLKPHVNRALSDFRSGRITIDGGGSVQEARKKGAKEGARVSREASGMVASYATSSFEGGSSASGSLHAVG